VGTGIGIDDERSKEGVEEGEEEEEEEGGDCVYVGNDDFLCRSDNVSRICDLGIDVCPKTELFRSLRPSSTLRTILARPRAP
jgi:hypothetical protein